MAAAGLADSLIENELGCGRFQILITIFLFLHTKISVLVTFIFMSFGNYNPGWRCLDNATISTSGSINATILSRAELSVMETRTTTDEEYQTDQSCAAFEACQHVEFNPESSTVVTEWNLICDKAWIPSFIISLQMAGTLIGATVSGQLADTIGRKKTHYGSLLINAVVTFASVFSVSWEMFAAFRFILGFLVAFFGGLILVYPSEFVPKKWRGPLAGLPGWGMSGVVFSLLAMLLKNWKHLLIAGSAVCFVSFLHVVWIPESLRWLEVKNKKEDFKRVVKKIASLNGKKIQQVDFILQDDTAVSRKVDTKTYTMVDLFHPGYKLYSVLIGFIWLLINVIFYSIGFGVKALHGSFYVNLTLIYAVLVLACVFPMFAPNILGRRLSTCIFMSLTAVCLLSATFFEKFSVGTLRITATRALFVTSYVVLNSCYLVHQVHLSEIYPTVVRGLAGNSASVMGRIGGVTAPFLIPNDPEMVYVWFLVMGCLGVVASGLISRLPETKGQPMKETFEDLPETLDNHSSYKDDRSRENV